MCDGRVAPPLGKKPKSSDPYVLSGIEALHTHDLCTAVQGPRFSSTSGSAHGLLGRTWHNGGLTRRIPQSFIDTVPRERLLELRYRVAWHQYHMMHATTLLRQSLPMPPRTDGIRSNADSRSTPIWYTKLRRRVVSLNPDDTTLRAQVHYKPREGGRSKRGPKRPRSSLDARASYMLQQPYSNNTACALLRLLSSLSPPLQARVHEYVSTPSTPSNLGPRGPPLAR